MRSWIGSPSLRRAPAKPRGGFPLSERTTGAAGRSGDDEAILAATAALDPREEVLCDLRGVGATMLLTPSRIVVARDGHERRPRSGVQAWLLEHVRQVGIELGTGTSGRVVVWTGEHEETVSMFFEARSLSRAEEFVAAARPLIARRRRGIPEPKRD
jgi:hypothetical protein